MESAPQPTKQHFQVSLSRDLGLYDVTMIGVEAMIASATIKNWLAGDCSVYSNKCTNLWYRAKLLIPI